VSPSPELFAVAVLLFVAIAAYALFAGADFGGGIWDLLAGGTHRGAAPREAIDVSVTPVWEGNHVWSIFVLVILWTAFPPAFAAIMTALFVPIALALLGVFCRGIGFAFRHEAERLHMQRLNGALFAISSLMAPFFLGTVTGAVATGAIPATPTGEIPGAWTSTTALLTGALFVATCAYIGAIYLVVDTEHRGQPDMIRYFTHRALAAGVVTGVLAAVNLLLMRTSAPYVFGRLVGPALPLLVVSVLAGITALILVALHRTRLLRIAAGVAVTAVVAGWGWAQYPWLLPGSLTLQDGAAPSATLWTELAVTGLAVLLVFPAFGWLYWLQQHGQLQNHETTESLRLATATTTGGGGEPTAPATPAPVQREHRIVATVLIATVATELVRQVLGRRRGRRR
jgi:cytochrome d ubiquinol oxidase subunit II